MAARFVCLILQTNFRIGSYTLQALKSVLSCTEHFKHYCQNGEDHIAAENHIWSFALKKSLFCILLLLTFQWTKCVENIRPDGTTTSPSWRFFFTFYLFLSQNQSRIICWPFINLNVFLQLHYANSALSQFISIFRLMFFDQKKVRWRFIFTMMSISKINSSFIIISQSIWNCAHRFRRGIHWRGEPKPCLAALIREVIFHQHQHHKPYHGNSTTFYTNNLIPNFFLKDLKTKSKFKPVSCPKLPYAQGIQDLNFYRRRIKLFFKCNDSCGE